ncbi:MAG: STAS domain-containing protein [Planctomycetota bacterium]
MNIEERKQGAVMVLRPRGPLVREDAEQFNEHAQSVAATTLGRVVIDTSAMPFVDSQGLEALVDLATIIEQGGRTLKLTGLNPTLRDVLQITGLTDRFETFDDPSAAVRSFL